MRVYLTIFSLITHLATVVGVPRAICNHDESRGDNGWYFGYQELGVQYTCFDSIHDDKMIIGGSMASGCKSIDPTMPNDYCAVLTLFEGDKR